MMMMMDFSRCKKKAKKDFCNLPGVTKLITVKILKDFREMAVARERIRLVPLKTIPTGNPTPLANAAIKIPPVITVDVITPVPTIPVIVLNRFIFLCNFSQTSISSRKNASISLNLFNQYHCGSCSSVRFKSG